MVLGDRNIVLYGPGFIKDRLMGLSFRISPSSFYQVNPVQTEVLYGKAMEFAAMTGKERVIDAYCGTAPPRRHKVTPPLWLRHVREVTATACILF